MTTAVELVPVSSSTSARSFGWAISVAGLALAGWWTATWARVHSLISDHVAAHGLLPGSSLERAGLYANGTSEEQRLSDELSGIAGLYPWGMFPLIIAALFVFFGIVLGSPPKMWRGVLAFAIALLIVNVPLLMFGDSMWIALDVLE